LQNAYDNTTPPDIDIILNGASLNDGILILNYATNVAGDGYLMKFSETDGVPGLAATEANPNTPFLEIMPRNISGMSAQINRLNSNQLVFGAGSVVNGNDVVAFGRTNALIGTDLYIMGRGNTTLGGSSIQILGNGNIVPAANPDATAINDLTILGGSIDLSTITTPDSLRIDERTYMPSTRGLMVIGGSTGAPAFVSLPGITTAPTTGNVTRIAFSGQVNGAQDPLAVYTLQMPLGRMYGGHITTVGFGDADDGNPGTFETAFYHTVDFIVVREAAGTRIVGFPVVTEISDLPGTSVLPVVSGVNIDIDIAGLVGANVTSINWSGWLDITEMNRIN
jgi:hypothetical protein